MSAMLPRVTEPLARKRGPRRHPRHRVSLCVCAAATVGVLVGLAIGSEALIDGTVYGVIAGTPIGIIVLATCRPSSCARQPSRRSDKRSPS